ncbi:hypothetical protein SBA5_30028 [Candidatus Sulfotelmatomonas gaucii]|uniref:Uncharacterized protein n=1 Tax=Candidatus Sulfuritelmatomonas gaucii TaxID=2043161 RepID=A0A2N9LCF6_9BACT|nr:hypothetical protein SBA5_30028 [Candidatus Sulfotelmatomonas gaucii]
MDRAGLTPEGGFLAAASITIWSFPDVSAKLMVGTIGFEPTTSSVSKPLYSILSTTYRPLGTAKAR